MTEENIPASWSQLIENYRDNATLQSRTCCIYNLDPQQPPKDKKARCPCGRLIRRHSFDGASVESNTLIKNNAWTPPLKFRDLSHSKNVPINVFGTLSPSGCKFLRVDNRFDPNSLEQLGQLYQLILQDCGGKEKKPGLIISVYGGAKYFVLTERLEKEVMRGIINAATTADAWILTAGLNNGVSKLVGEGMSHYRLLHDYSNKVKCIGLTMWGSINESGRLKLKEATEVIPGYNKGLIYRQIPDDQQEDNDGIEQNHSHCILFDDGKLSGHLSDLHRDKFVTVVCDDSNHACYSVTIIVEGGWNTLEVLENDIDNQRPIILIQDSGRLADVFASLVELTSNTERDPTEREIYNAFDTYFPNYTHEEAKSNLKRIKSILDKTHRHLLHVFRFDRDHHIAETIFKAIFAATKLGKKSENVTNQKIRTQEDRLLDLALEWDYIEGAAPILQKWQNEMIKKTSQSIAEDVERTNKLFRKSLEKNRPAFVDYFLSAGLDPQKLTQFNSKSSWNIWTLYKESRKLMSKSHQTRITTLFGENSPDSMDAIHDLLRKFVSPVIGRINIQSEESLQESICIDLCKCMCCCLKYGQYSADQPTESIALHNRDHRESSKDTQDEYSKYKMLRNLFLWAVFMDMPEMAKVLLIHIRSRVCAALIASAIFKQYANFASTVYLKEKLLVQALEFETYAAKCIDKCYEHNEKTACELLLRQVPLFGHLTCTQVAISSKSVKLLETACFDQALNQVWYSRLALSNSHNSSKPLLLISSAFFGFAAPKLIKYREKETHSMAEENIDFDLSPKGIDYYVDKNFSERGRWSKYCYRYFSFHGSPMVKMFYHFLSYIWFLLVFSYMMLYHLDPRTTFKVHWTEIYVIITVSTMLCEEIRQITHEYGTRMLEQRTSPGSSIGTWLTRAFYALPYLLFYLALGFRYAAGDDNALLTTGRIMLALDLEIWYLRSLKFVIALKFLGPKLFMLKNMLRDLSAFVYMIFIAIAAYGVVSRALILYKEVPFTVRGILYDIFYAPYWFIHGEVSDRELLDDRLENGTSLVVAETMVTHALLAFHMLFINILLLNLLIAVFADTIGKVQQNTVFYWRYQRYWFVREYFQRPFFAYPPLIIIPHLILVSLAIIHKCCPKLVKSQVDEADNVSKLRNLTPVFKMIPKRGGSLDEHWDLFENAATNSYAQSILKKHKMRSVLTNDDSILGKTTRTLDYDMSTSIGMDEKITSNTDQQQSMASVKEELNTLKSAFAEVQRNLSEITMSMQWVMDAISHVKMNDPNKPQPSLQLPTPIGDVIEATTITSSSH